MSEYGLPPMETNPIASPEETSIALSQSEVDNQRMYSTDVAPYLEILNSKQLKFVQALISNGLDHRKAAVSAGYSYDYGKKLLHDIRVRKAYVALVNQELFWDVASHAEVLKYASDVMRGKKTDTVLNPKTGEKEEMPVLQRDRKTAVELLAKHHKILADGKLDVSLRAGQTIVVDIEGFDPMEYIDSPKSPYAQERETIEVEIDD
ncbi:terminase small subunit [Bacillus pseudomycoides]|uniref:terminase small subunit n=1 Tax=Bacillus pseudomycoides TaxID=64104 RepID=UPI002E206F28|nr:terminase small subunit [Bacillus pseudomycoides]